ncbi:hypothetical protein ACGGZK_05420 [Agromyces sp. MMS24-K17]|uniref:hypothetical protein n=1 Tax=Agromyces sp. MMS24-K17 TaxID=3372850 RepID=UPI00375415BC
MDELLTDDEIVAVAGARGVGWPVPLVSVAGEERAITAAAFRGLRSLIVRGRARATGDGRTEIEPALAATVERAAKAPRVVIAHVSGGDLAGLAGAAAAVFIDDRGIVLDVADATGVHALEESDAATARARIVAFARTRFAPAPGLSLSSAGCVLIAASGEDRVLRVRPDHVEVGRVDLDDDGPRFAAASTTTFDAVDAFVANAVR